MIVVLEIIDRHFQSGRQVPTITNLVMRFSFCFLFLLPSITHRSWDRSSDPAWDDPGAIFEFFDGLPDMHVLIPKWVMDDLAIDECLGLALEGPG